MSYDKPLNPEEYANLLAGRSRYERLLKHSPEIAAIEYDENGKPRQRVTLSDLNDTQRRYTWERIKVESTELAEFLRSEHYQMIKTMFGAEVSLCKSWLDGYEEWLEATDGKGPVIYPPHYTG